MRVTLLPKTGAVINGKKLVLGCTRTQAEAVIGKPEDDFGICYYFGGGLALDYGDDGTLRYIECRNGTDTEIGGVNAFQTDADKLFEILAAENGDDIMDVEDGHSYIFNDIRVSVWRETTPEEVLEYIEADKAAGEEVSEEDTAEELRTAEHWETVGVFVHGYYG